MSEQATETDKDTAVRVSSKVHRRLLTIQYQRRMAGEALSFSKIIAEMLDDKEAFARMGETLKEVGL